MAQFRGHKASLCRFTTSPDPYRYHVFLSFRGVETRKNFTDHLYTALVNAGLRTFRDDPELERGENIKENLENAIRQSRCSVIVFSEDYTSSKWCLDELVTILHRKSTSDHVVLPVFYKVNPSQLRDKAESLAKVPKCYEDQSSGKLNAWRAALGEVADLAGMVLADGHESEFIQNIIEEIQDKLGRPPLTDIQEVLPEKLLSVDPFLDEAEGKQLKFKTTVKPWLHKLKEAVFHAEDLLQEIKAEVLRQKREREYGSSTSEVQELISTPSPAFNSALIYSGVEQVLERLDFIMEQRRDVLGMEASAEYKASQTIRTMSTSLVEDSGVCGRNKEKDTLTKSLLSDDESGKKISVVPIVGMGGIGKTTLAQFLYTDARDKQHFDLLGWACVSKEFDVFRISQHIYESLTRRSCQITSLDLLQSDLQETLSGKRFLIVLDDIWTKNYNELQLLMLPFHSALRGSKIIVTTRDENVARIMGNLEAHHLKPLSEEEGWSLFKNHAFKYASGGARSHLEEIGRQIVRKCNGLPLAIKSLGGLLCSKFTVGEWESILDSEMWELPDESEILPSLWLSYVDLPLHLKRCIAYCSIFPKNYNLVKSELIYLWMTGDLLQPRKNKTAEEIGHDYFNDLASRSFFQLSSNRYHYVMHDLINDLVNFVSGEFCFRWEGKESPNTLSKIRHISAVTEFVKPASLRLFQTLQQAKCLFTFLSLRTRCGVELYDVLPQLRCLRVLKLRCRSTEELPDSISDLKLLRHLDLSMSGLKKLPDTICTLYNLQVLLLRHCPLTNLPANLGRLINLSHLGIEDTELQKMPPNMGNLKGLQMLPYFFLDKETAADNLPELKELQNLRGSLRILGLVHSSGLGAYILADMKFLKELALAWGITDHSDREDASLKWNKGRNTLQERKVLEKLQPHLNLERLTIYGYGGHVFPGWSGYYSSSTLAYLYLLKCKNIISLPPLGQLPSLRELHIKGLHRVVSVGSEFYYGDGSASASVNKPFRSLRSLTFEDMIGWKEWSFVGGNAAVTFPNLTDLKIVRCWKLNSWPEQMHSLLPSLVSLLVEDCPELECNPQGDFPSLLESLAIRRCNLLQSMQNLNKALSTLTSRDKLTLDFDWFQFRSEFSDLRILGMNSETMGAIWFDPLNSLQKMEIMHCLMLRCWPDGGLPASLEILKITDCPALECLPDGGLPASLKILKISCCPALECLPDGGLPASLEILEISCCPALECLPDGGLLASLKILKITHCPALECLPDGGLPASLKNLEIYYCPALECLPDSRLPDALDHLVIIGCPLLHKRCQRETGEDWPKISHVPYIQIDRELI